MPKPKKRGAKGRVHVHERGKNKMLILRFSYAGAKYQIATGLPNSPANRFVAEGKAAEIEADIRLDRFDPTLNKYRPQPAIQKPLYQTTLDLLQGFIQYLDPGDSSYYTKWRPLLNNLKRFGKSIDDELAARQFVEYLRPRQPSASNNNNNLSRLQKFGDWAVEQGHWTENHFQRINPLPSEGHRVMQPFTRAEISRLLTAAATDKHCSKHRHLIYFLMHSGCRPSEAIGLRWKHVDIPGRRVQICESLSRHQSGAGQIRKGTKTGKARFVPLTENVAAMFEVVQQEHPTPEGESLVFFHKKSIKDHQLRAVWVRLCKAADVEYRSPYNARHTVISHMIEARIPLTQIAAVMGHSLQTLMKTYAHMINLPEMLQF